MLYNEIEIYIILLRLMKSNSLKKAISRDNQFLETPKSNRQSIKEKQKLSEDIKAKYIQELEDRNRKLKYEIIKINEMLEQQKDKQMPKKQYKLIPQQSSSEVVRRELDNAYKQIKNYEREISQLEAKQAGGMITDKMSRLQTILKDKTKHLDKLKGELSVLTKTSLQNSKKLQNNAGKQQLQNAMLKYNQEIKVLREKVRQAQNKEKRKVQNAQKQFQYIQCLQQQLIKNGVKQQQLEQMKKNNIFNQIYDKMNGEKAQSSNKQQKNGQQQKDEVQDMTVDRYMELKNEIKLYKKLQLDYDKRLEGLEKQKVKQQKQSTNIKAKLKEKDDEIQKLQQQITELKAKIKKVNLKANYSGTKNQSSEKPKVKPPRSPTKLRSSNAKSTSDQTHIKYDEKGQATDKGSRFTDRTVIGKATDVKIICVKVWTEKSTFAINGIQCIYKIGDKVKYGMENIGKQAKKGCTENVIELNEGDYIKSISGHLNQGNVIQYLVFMSKNNVVGRMGVAKQTQKQFNYDIDQDELPICMYGSIVGGRDSSTMIENLGFEITKDKVAGKQEKFI